MLGGGAPPSPPATPPPPVTPPAPGATPPAFRDLVLQPDGSFAPDFIQHLPDDLKGHAATLGRFPNVVELTRSYVNARSKLGERPAPPGEGATPEQVKAWRELVGVPESPDGYGLKKPEKLPEGVEYNEAMDKEFAAFAHQNNILPNTVNALREWFYAKTGEGVKAVKEQEEAWYKETIANQEKEIQQAWGDKTDENYAQAMRAARTFGLPEGKPADWSPKDVLVALHRASQMLGEDKLISTTGGGTGKHPSQIAMEVMDPTNSDRTARAYRGEFGPGEQAAAQEYVNKLLQQAEATPKPGLA